MHSSKIFLITLFLVSILLLNGCSKVDTSQCDNLDSSDIEGKFSCYNRLALETLNSDVCDKLMELSEQDFSPYRNSCKIMVIAASNSTDMQQCEQFLDTHLQASCYFHTVVASQNPSLCKKAAWAAPENDEDSADSCISSIAIQQKDMNICKQINQYLAEVYPQQSEQEKIYRIDWCLLGYALHTKDPTVCELISVSKDACYRQMAVIFKDETYCMKLSKEIMSNNPLIARDSCFEEIATLKRNKQICDNIEPVELPSPANLPGPLAQMMPSDPLYRRKACYDAVDRTLGLAPAHTAGPVSNWNFNPTPPQSGQNTISLEPDSCLLGHGFACLGFSATTTGRIMIVMQNGIGDNINDVVVTLANSNPVCTTASGTATGGVFTGARSIIDGGSATYSMTCAGRLTKGAKLKGDLQMTYTIGTGASNNIGQLVVEIKD